MNEEKAATTLSDTARGFGVFIASILMASSSILAGWVLCKRKSPVVKAMQPLFLILLCAGMIISLSAIVPLGADDANTENPDAACMARLWLESLGTTLVMSALFSKLWRVNKIFHAQGFQKKVVTAKDVLWPLCILLSLNLFFLITQAAVDPPVWKIESQDDEDSSQTIGFCSYNGQIGALMEGLVGLINFTALVVLCVQAYRARDIRSEFSEARGVALALFAGLQSLLITIPIQALLEDDEVDIKYTLFVLGEGVSTAAMQFFIFAPLISHHRQFEKGNRTTFQTHRVTGFNISVDSENENHTLTLLNEAQSRIIELDSQIAVLLVRNCELERIVNSKTETLDGTDNLKYDDSV